MNSTSIAQPVTQVAGAPVSWQTIFWTLLPLAISSMTQPGGRICGLPSRYRTYLRCSPILCAADAFSVVFQLTVLCQYHKHRFSEAVGTILHERFNTDKHSQGQQVVLQDGNEEETETVHSVEAMTWLRWLWFILGTLPPAIKLMSMSGVRWEQAWGMMFLTSWMINESLIIYAATNHTFFTISRSGRISWPGIEQMKLSSKYRKFRARVTAAQYRLAVSALVVHVVILNGVFRVVFRRWRYSSSAFWSNVSSSAYPFDPRHSIISVVPVIAKSICMIGFVALFSFILRQLGFKRSSALVFPIFDAFLVFVNLLMNVMICSSCNSSLSPEIIFGLTNGAYLGIFTLVYYMSSWSVTLGKNLLVAFPDRNENSPKIDHGGFLSLFFFLSTVLGAILWYGYIYDSDGTLNPSWTGIFG